MLIRRIPIYNYQTEAFTPLTNENFLKTPFYIELPLPTSPTEEKTLLSVPGALIIRLINRSYDSDTEDVENIRGENCFIFNDKNE